jgi:hypothetical protein
MNVVLGATILRSHQTLRPMGDVPLKKKTNIYLTYFWNQEKKVNNGKQLTARSEL